MIKRNPIGIQATASLGISMSEIFSMLKQHGFEATFTHTGTPEELCLWADAIARNSLIYSSIHAPFRKAALMWKDGLDGETAEKELHDAIDACAAVEVPILVVHPYIGFNPPYIPTPIGLERFRRLAEHAERKGVRLAIENVEGEEFLAYLLTGLKDYHSVGFCLDTGHELCYNKGRDLLADYGDRLLYLHINSNMGVTDPNGVITYLDDAHMLPFDGSVDMEHFANRLKKLCYDGPLMMEMSRGNQKGRNTNDRYLAMTDDEYLSEAASRIKKLRDTVEKE